MEFSPDVDTLLDHHTPNDPVVIEAIVHVYYAPIHRLASSFLDDAAEADDAVQETFIKAALNLDHYRTGTNFKAWLYTITVNTCRGILRKRNVRKKLHSLLAMVPYSVFSHQLPEENLIRAETQDTLRAALIRLPEKHRFPILLRFVHGLPISEIALILGVREGTVHSRLHYGIQKLRSQME